MARQLFPDWFNQIVPQYKPTLTENWLGGGLPPTQQVAQPFQPVLQPQNPQASAPASQPQPQQPSGAPPYPSNVENQTVSYGGQTFKADGRGGWTLQSQSPWSSAPQGPSLADLDAIYSPAQATLNAQEAAFRAEQGPAEQKVGTSYQEGLALLEKTLAEQQAKLGKQGQAIGTAKQNALAQARQLYSELQQKYGAMFGSRSSAGPAAQELLGRETTKQFAGIENQSTQAFQDIESERTRLTSWVGDQKNTLLQKKNDAMGEIQRTFTQGLAQINAQRGALESAKAQQRVDLLNQARAQTQQVEAATTQFNRQIQMFQTQQEAQLQQMSYAKTLQGYNPAPINPPQIGVQNTQLANNFTTTTGGPLPGQIWDPISRRYVYPGQ